MNAPALVLPAGDAALAEAAISIRGVHKSFGGQPLYSDFSLDFAKHRITTIFGLAPLVLIPGAGTELYRGVGAIVLFGLLFATIVTLVFLPALLVEIFSWRRRTAAPTRLREVATDAPVAPPGLAADNNGDSAPVRLPRPSGGR